MAAMCVSQGRTEGWVRRGQNVCVCGAPCGWGHLLDTNARSMGNKQEYLEAIVQQGNYGLVASTEVQWDHSHDWSAAVEGYRLFRSDRQGRRFGGVALCVRECFDVDIRKNFFSE